MLDEIPTVLHVMRTFPHTVEADDTLEWAHSVMRQRQIGHLPVKEKGELVGIVSERELLECQRAGHELGSTSVRHAINDNPLVVPTTARLDDVVLRMSDRGDDAALVVRERQLAGILTATDVCRILGVLLRTNQIPAHEALWQFGQGDDGSDDDGDVA